MTEEENKNTGQNIRIDELEQRNIPLLKIDESVAKCVIKAVTESFKVIFNVDITNDKPFETDGSKIDCCDYTVVMSMLQDVLEASFNMSFSKDLLRYSLKNVYSEDQLKDDSILQDSASEITNVVYGLIKTELNSHGYSFKTTLPTVIVGDSHSLYQRHNGINLCIPFHINDEVGFSLNVLLQKI